MKLKAEDFDWLGLLSFPFILIYGIYAYNGSTAPQWANVVLMVIGVLGILIDGTIIRFVVFGKKPIIKKV